MQGFFSLGLNLLHFYFNTTLSRDSTGSLELNATLSQGAYMLNTQFAFAVP